jgi:hypothetical protein
LETAWNGSPAGQLAGRSLTSIFQSPEFSRGPGRDRFAVRGDRFRPGPGDAGLADNGAVRSRQVGSGEPEPLFLVRPDCRQVADKLGDGEIGRRPTVGDRLDDSRREIGERH